MKGFHQHRKGNDTGNLTVSCDSNVDGEIDEDDKIVRGGGYLENPPSPTSPFTPSPRRIRIGRVAKGRSIPHSDDTYARPEVFHERNSLEFRGIVEVRVHGNLRTSESEWIPDAIAWFPAELHKIRVGKTSKTIWAQVMGCRLSSQPHPD